MRERTTIAEIRTSLAACAAHDVPALLAELQDDTRAGVRALACGVRRRLERERRESERLDALMAMQRALHLEGCAVVAGVDEVGRGALAGPVTTCAVVLGADTLIVGLDDSKRLTRERRAHIAALVRERAVAFCVAHAGPDEIDALGITAATHLAWRRAVDGLGIPVDHVLVDGNDAALGHPATAVIGGDARVAAIAAASCVAKVERDRLMEELASSYPGYGLELNRGYGTAVHLAAIARLGPSPVHRRSFAPCSNRARLF